MSYKALHVELLVRMGPDIIKPMSNTSRLTMQPHEYLASKNIITALVDHYGANLERKRCIFSSLAVEKILMMIKQDNWGYAKKSYSLANNDTEYNAAIQNWRRDSRKCVIPNCICHQCSEFKWGLEITVFVRNKKTRIGDEVDSWDVILRAEDFRVQDAANVKFENEQKKLESSGAGVGAQALRDKQSAAITDESDTSSDDMEDHAAEEDNYDDETTDDDTTDDGAIDDDAADYEADEEDDTDGDTMDEDTTNETARDCVLSRRCARVPART